MITLKDKGMFAEFFDRYRIERPTDACQLLWKTLGVSAAFTGLGLLVGLYIMGAVMIWWSPFFLHPAVAWFLTITAAAAALGVCWLIGEYRYNYDTPPWIENACTAYDGFKEKYCPLVTYKETADAQ